MPLTFSEVVLSLVQTFECFENKKQKFGGVKMFYPNTAIWVLGLSLFMFLFIISVQPDKDKGGNSQRGYKTVLSSVILLVIFGLVFVWMPIEIKSHFRGATVTELKNKTVYYLSKYHSRSFEYDKKYHLFLGKVSAKTEEPDGIIRYYSIPVVQMRHWDRISGEPIKLSEMPKIFDVYVAKGELVKANEEFVYIIHPLQSRSQKE